MTVEFLMPQLGETVAEGTITQWYASVGDSISASRPICEVSTDKVDTEIHPPIDGVLAQIVVGVGETVDVGTVIAVLEGDGQLVVAPAEAGVAVEASPRTVIDRPSAPPSPRSSTAAFGRLSPVVRRLADDNAIDLLQLPGTGAGGRITKRDVLEHLERRPAMAPAAAVASVHASAQSAQACLASIEIDYSTIDGARSPDLDRLAFVVFAACRAFRSMPEVADSPEPAILVDDSLIDMAASWRLPQLGAAIAQSRQHRHAGAEAPVAIRDFTAVATGFNLPFRAPTTRLLLAVQPVAPEVRPVITEHTHAITVAPRGSLVVSYDPHALHHDTVVAWLTAVAHMLETRDWIREL